MPSPPRLVLFALLTGGLLSGCTTAGTVSQSVSRSVSKSVKRVFDKPSAPSYVPDNYVGVDLIPKELVRVGVLPLHSDDWTASDLSLLDQAMSAELGKFDRFEIQPLSREALARRFNRGSFLSSSALPEHFLTRIAEDFGLDGVIFVDLTQYSPYQPISIGLRSKLVALATADVLWTFDSVFDSAQPDVAVAARRYHENRSRPAYPLDSSVGIQQSPARFAKYAAHAMFETLPPRERP